MKRINYEPGLLTIHTGSGKIRTPLPDDEVPRVIVTDLFIEVHLGGMAFQVDLIPGERVVGENLPHVENTWMEEDRNLLEPPPTEDEE